MTVRTNDVPVAREFRDAMLALPTAAGVPDGKMAPESYAKGKIECTVVCPSCLRAVPSDTVADDRCVLCR